MNQHHFQYYFCVAIMSSPLPDPEKFNSPLKWSSPASQNFSSPPASENSKFLSHLESRVGKTVCTCSHMIAFECCSLQIEMTGRMEFTWNTFWQCEMAIAHWLNVLILTVPRTCIVKTHHYWLTQYYCSIDKLWFLWKSEGTLIFPLRNGQVLIISPPFIFISVRHRICHPTPTLTYLFNGP